MIYLTRNIKFATSFVLTLHKSVNHYFKHKKKIY